MKLTYFPIIAIFTFFFEFKTVLVIFFHGDKFTFFLGEFKKSQQDIDKVLELEERHFGALAGQGLVNIHLKNYEKAINSYKKVQEIYPSMKSSEIMIKEIEMLIKKQSI